MKIEKPEFNLGTYLLAESEGSEYSIENVEPDDVVALLNACSAAYEKHHCGNENIGWNELSDKLFRAIKNIISSETFEKWQSDCDRTRLTTFESET